MSEASADLPNVDMALFQRPAMERGETLGTSAHPPRVLLLFGSLRVRSYSKLLALEAQRLLQAT